MEQWRVVNSKGNGPFAIKTLLGWVVSGLLHDEHICLNKHGKPYVCSHQISVERVSELLVQQFNHDFPESAYEKVEMSQEDLRFLDIMDTSAKLQDGHYQLPLPFKRGPKMPNNRLMAEQRAVSLKRELGRNKTFQEEYKLFMDTFLKCGHAELVPREELVLQNGKGWYIPHHGVYHPKKGNFYALRRAAEDHKNNFSTEAVNTVLNNFYLDDLLKAVDTEAHAIHLYQELKSLCAVGGFNLTKWSSNSRAVLAHIPELEKAKRVKDLDLDLEDLPLDRALGVHWCAEEDIFKFHVFPKEQPCTRRGILSMVSSMYDPLGFLAPVTFSAKHLLQELCRLNLSWDQDIPNAHTQSWKRWLHGLGTLINFNITHCFKPKHFGAVKRAQLHHFCDASEAGYGTVTYLRLVNNQDEVHIALVMGKSRVAPLKLMTTPRLELTAAVLATRIDRMLATELQLHLEPSVFWTDSTTVLKYETNDTRRFHTFVANRVNTIRGISDVFQWKHIPGKMNPADYASRGLNAEEFLRNNIWINGPKFLADLPKHWPNQPVELAVSSDDSELKRKVFEVHATVAGQFDATSTLLNYFSTWSKLRTAVAWILKLKSLLAQHVLKSKGALKTSKAGPMSLSVQDIEEAEEAIVKFCKSQGFPQEMASLHNGKSVDRKSSIFKLDPVLDRGILRVGGRLSKIAMPEEQKHPAILPKGHHASKLLLCHIHQQEVQRRSEGAALCLCGSREGI
ncbi:hypothetical protein SRHO_G00224510 [Serrasalmus rhombeus]